MKKRKILAISLICLMAFALFAACGSDGIGGGIGGASAKEIIAKSAEAMNDVKNYKATMDMDMQMISEGEITDMKISSDMDMFMDPLKIKMAMSMQEPSTGMTMDMDTYVIPEGSNMVSYMYVYGMWMKQTQPFSEDLLSQYNHTQYSKMFNDSLKKAEIVAEESVNGVACWKIDVTIDAKTMMDMMQNMQGGQDMLDAVTTDMLSKMGDMTATLWISKDNYYQMKVDMDMTTAMTETMSDMGVELTKMAISMTLFDFGNATDFTLPEEAKNAMDIPSS